MSCADALGVGVTAPVGVAVAESALARVGVGVSVGDADAIVGEFVSEANVDVGVLVGEGVAVVVTVGATDVQLGVVVGDPVVAVGVADRGEDGDVDEAVAVGAVCTSRTRPTCGTGSEVERTTLGCMCMWVGSGAHHPGVYFVISPSVGRTRVKRLARNLRRSG